MRTPSGLFELVRDALVARHMTWSGCFVWNASCAQLEAMGPQALPAIEAVIAAEVLPHYFWSTKSLERRSPGLAALLVTYFVVGKDHGDGRVLRFFDRLCGSVRVEAMRAVNTVWHDRAPTAPIPEPILGTVRQLADEGSGEVRDTAVWLFEQAENHRSSAE